MKFNQQGTFNYYASCSIVFFIALLFMHFCICKGLTCHSICAIRQYSAFARINVPAWAVVSAKKPWNCKGFRRYNRRHKVRLCTSFSQNYLCERSDRPKLGGITPHIFLFFFSWLTKLVSLLSGMHKCKSCQLLSCTSQSVLLAFRLFIIWNETL